MITLTARHPNATLVRSMDTGLLLYSEGLWQNPKDAVRAHPECFWLIPYTTARELFGDMVPEWPGEWALVPNDWPVPHAAISH